MCAQRRNRVFHRSDLVSNQWGASNIKKLIKLCQKLGIGVENDPYEFLARQNTVEPRRMNLFTVPHLFWHVTEDEFGNTTKPEYVFIITHLS